MTLSQITTAADPCQDSYRWPRQLLATASDRAHDPDTHISQRLLAEDLGVPRSTLGYWLRRDTPPGVDPNLARFLRSSPGQAFLRRLYLALFLAFSFSAPAGLRCLQRFLRHTQLDSFVASSTGALQLFASGLEARIRDFGREENARLAAGMAPRDIALVADEHFHEGTPCLVALEPRSNFLLVEQYSPRRDAATWGTVITTALAGLPVSVLLLCSDQAGGLIACAESELDAEHLPELFHGQRDLSRPLFAALGRNKAHAESDLREASDRLGRFQARQEALDATGQRGGFKSFLSDIALWQDRQGQRQKRLAEVLAKAERARQAVCGLADDYHPFDPQTGVALSGEEVGQRMESRLAALRDLSAEMRVPGEALERGGRWVLTLSGLVSWYWSVVRLGLRELNLGEDACREAEKALAGQYWKEASRRGRTPEERRRRKVLGSRLLAEAWGDGSVLGGLPADTRSALRGVIGEWVGLFAPSSSGVEGRNSRLWLHRHGKCRLSESRLGALTVLHNYDSEREDGTTAAERFFGSKPRDLFTCLLEGDWELPGAAARRPRKLDPEASLSA